MNSIAKEPSPRDHLLGIHEAAVRGEASGYPLSHKAKEDLEYLVSRLESNKGVYTVLITLALYKMLNPEQDIRQHKAEFQGGFSGRSFDTRHVTPTLKELKLPSMAESGWLTRSLEQPYPFDENFQGRISPDALKQAFLRSVAYIQEGEEQAKSFLINLMEGAISARERNHVEIQRLIEQETHIDQITSLLSDHFRANYETHGGAKLPVLGIYALYSLMLDEVGRFEGAILLPLGSHTASDRTSRSSGDIEVSRGGKVFEAVEVKLDKPVSSHMIRIAFEKINKFGVERYYILSDYGIADGDEIEIERLVSDIASSHGCQIIIDGVLNSLGHSIRLLSSPGAYLNKYVDLVEQDTELHQTHKMALKNLMATYFGAN